jgi:hypothetical protein
MNEKRNKINKEEYEIYIKKKVSIEEILNHGIYFHFI